MGGAAARKAKEEEICHLLLSDPKLIDIHAETLAGLPFSDPLLDRFRQELLNLAASGIGLEGEALNDHLSRLGMGDLLAHLRTKNLDVPLDHAQTENAGDGEAKFLLASRQLRDLAYAVPANAEAAKVLQSVVRRNAPG